MERHSSDSARLACGVILLGIYCTLAVTARAGGFEYGVQGAETVARSGANVAKVMGPEALYLNVAGIGKSDGIEILFDANFIHAKMWADLYGNGQDSWGRIPGVTGTIDYIPINNSTDIYLDGFKLFPAPYVGVTFPIPQFKKISLGLGVFGPAALGSFQFPKTVAVEHEGNEYQLPSPQRYDLIDQEVVYVWPTIAASYKLTEQITLGAGFQWGVLHLKFSSAANTTRVSTSGSHNNDIIAMADAWDYFIPAGILGMTWNPLDRIEMGWSLRISGKIKAKGKITTIANPWSDDPIYSNDPTLEWLDVEPYSRPKGTLTFKWPTTVYRFGIRYIHPKKNAPIKEDRSLYPWEGELFDIELGFFLEQNHVVDSMKMRIEGQIPLDREGLATPFKPDENHSEYIRRNWRDVFSVRLGGSVNLLKGLLTINWGGFYESPTSYKADTRLDYLPGQRFGVSCGLQGRFFAIPIRKKHLGIEASLSYIHFFFPEIKVEEGKIKHINAMHPSGTVINNGDYEFAMDVLTAGLRVTVM